MDDSRLDIKAFLDKDEQKDFASFPYCRFGG